MVNNKLERLYKRKRFQSSFKILSHSLYVWPTTSPPSVSRLSLTMWDLQHLTRLLAATVCYGDNSKEMHLRASAVSYGDSFTFLYVDNVRTSQETCLWASTVCCGDGFTFLYICDVHTSQETYLWASSACYADSCTFTLLLSHHSLNSRRYKSPRMSQNNDVMTSGMHLASIPCHVYRLLGKTASTYLRSCECI
jgi:hypothetical protein